jgi:hypothetical protein
MADITWTEVKSTNVAKVAYDENADELLIEFRSGGIYAYPSAGEAAYQDLLYSTSPGQYVSRWLKGQPARRVK